MAVIAKIIFMNCLTQKELYHAGLRNTKYYARQHAAMYAGARVPQT